MHFTPSSIDEVHSWCTGSDAMRIGARVFKQPLMVRSVFRSRERRAARSGDDRARRSILRRRATHSYYLYIAVLPAPDVPMYVIELRSRGRRQLHHVGCAVGKRLAPDCFVADP